MLTYFTSKEEIASTYRPLKLDANLFWQSLEALYGGLQVPGLKFLQKSGAGIANNKHTRDQRGQ